MFAEQRRQKILTLLHSSGTLRTRDLASRFGVSEVTIRSDLELLDGKRALQKTHGGAVPVSLQTLEADFGHRMLRNADAKRRIGQLAAHEFHDNQTVVFDSGSTMMQLAMHLPPFKNLVVATPAMNIAQFLMNRSGLDVHMIGGRVSPETVSTLLTNATSTLDGLVAHQVFMGAHAIDSSFDIVDQNEDVARSKRNLVQMARRVILVADSSKWNVSGTSKAFPLSRVDLVITDSGLAVAVRKQLERQKIQVLFA